MYEPNTSSTCFFSKISSYQSTLKIPYATHRRAETSSLPNFVPPSPILSNSFFININPSGIEFAKMLVHCHGFGNVVARGYHLHV